MSRLSSSIRAAIGLAAAIMLMMPLAGCGNSGAGSAASPASSAGESSQSTTSSQQGVAAKSTNVAWEHLNGTDLQTAYMSYTEDATLGAHARQLLEESVTSTPNIDKAYVDSVTTDGNITADEMNAAEQRAVDCFAGHGMTANRDYWFGLDGGLVTDPHGTVADDNAVSDECMYGNGYEALRTSYLDAVRNPDGVDLDPYRLQCYKDYKLVDQDYSYEQYQRDQDSGQSRLNSVDPATPAYRDYVECLTDPLHTMTSDMTGVPSSAN
ncbi:hypothetical protein [Bifidobacterium callimiconis]|uniref:Lipoprotein n=1 Tax=Bifidobacterium callimiconis TaxID=2306973 RepID=A0A430F7W3_9BIFI|nr:hypothetical protein [Bifidobacterium callimiconis]RSX49003.1 hypothetical protein D2E23_2154 [Bifidobacterium callimiconis]